MLGKKAIEFQYARERRQAAPNVSAAQVRSVKVMPLGPLNGMHVWLVDSESIRRLFDIDFTMGSHDAHSAFIPHGEIWVSRLLPPSDLAPLLVHEAVERQWMVFDKKSYEDAHDRASAFETILRKKIHRYVVHTRAQAMDIARKMTADILRKDRSVRTSSSPLRVLLFSTVAHPARAARLHAVGCNMVRTAKRSGGKVRRVEATEENIQDLDERGFPVKECPCLRRRA